MNSNNCMEQYKVSKNYMFLIQGSLSYNGYNVVGSGVIQVVTQLLPLSLKSQDISALRWVATLGSKSLKVNRISPKLFYRQFKLYKIGNAKKNRGSRTTF